MQLSRRTRIVAAITALAAVGLTACGDDDNQAALSGDPTSTTSEATTTTEPAPEIAVTGIDYAFQGIPPKVKAGTSFTFRNGSEKEAHELVLVKIKDGETRPVQELLELPEEEANKVTEFKGVSVAPEPGGEGTVVEGQLLADVPGRYVALCFIQVGTDPAKMLEAMEEGHEPEPDPNAGPPHFTRGMVTEFTAE